MQDHPESQWTPVTREYRRRRWNQCLRRTISKAWWVLCRHCHQCIHPEAQGEQSLPSWLDGSQENIAISKFNSRSEIETWWRWAARSKRWWWLRGRPSRSKIELGIHFPFRWTYFVVGSEAVQCSGSSTEAEYVALGEAGRELLWLQKHLKDVGEKTTGPFVIREDNQSCLAMLRAEGGCRWTKHIDTRYNFIRDLVNNNVIQIQYCPSELMIADVLTKPLSKVKCRKKMGLQSLIAWGGVKESMHAGLNLIIVVMYTYVQ